MNKYVLTCSHQEDCVSVKNTEEVDFSFVFVDCGYHNWHVTGLFIQQSPIWWVHITVAIVPFTQQSLSGKEEEETGSLFYCAFNFLCTKQSRWKITQFCLHCHSLPEQILSVNCILALSICLLKKGLHLCCSLWPLGLTWFLNNVYTISFMKPEL